MVGITKLIACFLRRTDGGGTITSLYIIAILAVLLGIGLDATNGWRNRTYLTSVADMGAHAGAVAIAHKKTEAEIVEQVRRIVEANMPTSIWGNVLDATVDVALAEYDPETSSFVTNGTGKKNAVVVHLERTAARGNPIETLLLKLVGVATMDVHAVSAGVFDVSGICNATDGFFAKDRVRISTQADIGGGICVHSENYVWLPQQNRFRPGSYVTMPNLALCEDKCEDSANPGIKPVESHVVLPDFGQFIRDAHRDFQLGVNESETKYEFFTDDPDDPLDAVVTLGDLSELLDDGVLTAAHAATLGIGSVVDLTHTQFHDLHELPSGLVYRVDCPNNGNGGSTRLRFDDSTGQMEDAVLLTDCSLDFDDGARIAGSVIITVRESSSATVTAGQDTKVGDPGASCKKEDRSIIMSLSPVSVPSEFIMSNLTLIVDSNVDIASATSSGPTSHGFAVYATGTVDVASQHTFRACGLKGDYLTPAGKVLRLVLPPSPQVLASMP